MSETKQLAKEWSFIWSCPECGTDQTEIITIHGPVMSLRCAGCDTEFGPSDLPEPIRAAWETAVDRVIPKDEDE